jgi:hypothetical protein
MAVTARTGLPGINSGIAGREEGTRVGKGGCPKDLVQISRCILNQATRKFKKNSHISRSIATAPAFFSVTAAGCSKAASISLKTASSILDP